MRNNSYCTAMFLRLFLSLFLALGVSGCTVKLIADYDKKTDEAVTALQRKISTFLIDVESKLGTSQADYSNSTETYKELRVDVQAIELRVNALPKNDITQEQIKKLKDNLALLEQLHKKGFAEDLEGKRAVLTTVQEDFDTALAAILKLELAKRRGEDPKE